MEANKVDLPQAFILPLFFPSGTRKPVVPGHKAFLKTSGFSIDTIYDSHKFMNYQNWIENYKEGRLLIIDVDDLDFVEKQEDFGYILERIDGELNGLF